MRTYLLTLLSTLYLCTGCAKEQMTMDQIAESYVKLVLEVGLYDQDLVDAYYGPEEWKPAESSKKAMFPFARFSGEVESLQKGLAHIDDSKQADLEQARKRMLTKNLVALRNKIGMINGTTITFDDEAKALYDAVVPAHPVQFFAEAIRTLDSLVPGKGPLNERIKDFKRDFIIPPDRLDTVFRTAIREARQRTLVHIPLPKGENFKVEYVRDKAWSGYNWYKGNSYSLIQLNTDLDIYIDRAIDLACHEGYPGHHVYNVLIEQNLAIGKKWVEYQLYPLFSPQSLIAEGSANYGIEVAFPGAQRIKYEREVLFPLAGIDPSRADLYYKIQAQSAKLSYAGNEAARGYLDGLMTADETVAWLIENALYSEERARQRLKFIEKYRSYVINYNLGLDLVRGYIERNGGTADNPEKRWALFKDLLSRPVLPSELKP